MILTHKVGAKTTNFTTNLIVNESYLQGSQTATSDFGTEVLSITGDSVDTSVVASYTVNYVATEDGGDADVSTIVETVAVAAAPVVPGAVDEFIDGTNDRFGKDTALNPSYKDAVTNPPAEEIKSALFDENAMDPYELANANKNK